MLVPPPLPLLPLLPFETAFFPRPRSVPFQFFVSYNTTRSPFCFRFRYSSPPLQLDIFVASPLLSSTFSPCFLYPSFFFFNFNYFLLLFRAFNPSKLFGNCIFLLAVQVTSFLPLFFQIQNFITCKYYTRLFQIDVSWLPIFLPVLLWLTHRTFSIHIWTLLVFQIKILNRRYHFLHLCKLFQ